MATITDVIRFFKQMQGAAKYANDETPGWLNHKSILPGIRIRFGNRLPWTETFDDITDEPLYPALQAIADKQQTLFFADLMVPGNYRGGPEDVQPGDFLPLYMMMKSRLLGTNVTPWHSVRSESYDGSMFSVLSSLSEMTSGYLPASTVYTKIFTPRVQAENNCTEMKTGTAEYHEFRSAMHANPLFEAVDPLRSHLIMHPDFRGMVDPAKQHAWNVEKMLAPRSGGISPPITSFPPRNIRIHSLVTISKRHLVTIQKQLLPYHG
jgi:hypothetical protein